MFYAEIMFNSHHRKKHEINLYATKTFSKKQENLDNEVKKSVQCSSLPVLQHVDLTPINNQVKVRSAKKNLDIN